MKVVQSIEQCRAARAKYQSLALVPTMGALHGGHMSLMAEARKRAAHVAVSIFVNPTQFGPKEDFTRYPRPVEADLVKCRSAGVDLVFNPSVEAMYPAGQVDVIVDLPQITGMLEGKHRPGHFKGVCQIVSKLFNIIKPDFACFGQKDFQQLRVITAMVEALNLPIQIVGCPTMRENDGLALSSRNQYLSVDERQRALAIPRALQAAQEEVKQGIVQTNRLVATVQKILLDVGNLGKIPVSIDYVAAVDPLTLKPADLLDRPIVLAIAARVGLTRLIDNVVVKPK